jgi:hypothetical protein
MNKNSCRFISNSNPLKIVEGVESIWHYHLSESGLNGKPTLCGITSVMQTNIPLSSWGIRSHLPKKYCAKCFEKATTEG